MNGLILGTKVEQKHLDKWLPAIQHVLLQGETVEIVVHTAGIRPTHDHLIITSHRLWCAQFSSLPRKLAYHFSRDDIVYGRAHGSKLIFTVAGSAKLVTPPLAHPEDTRLVLDVLGIEEVVPPVITPPAPPEPEEIDIPEGFVPYGTQPATPQQPAFRPTHAPGPGEPVPADCVWASVPHPGPLPRGALRASSKIKGMRKLGNPAGRLLVEIRGVLGSESAVSTLGNGDLLYQWEGKHTNWRQAYHYSMTFDRYGVCAGLDSRWEEKY